MNEIYEPIKKEIQFWISYYKNKPKSIYRGNEKIHDEFRAKNDKDCVLNNGNLFADTIFSLWLPLRFCLVIFNSYEHIYEITKCNIKSDDIDFLFMLNEKIDQLLPCNEEIVRKLSRLFILGQEKCNTMILPDRSLQSRGKSPRYDYMPYFLYDCFIGGEYSFAFDNNDNVLKDWVEKQKLNDFFNGEIVKENIRDLAGSGDIKNNNPKDINFLLNNYIDILEKRKKRMEEENA